MIILPPSPSAPGNGAPASGICRELVKAGVTHAVTVPDFVQFSVHERLATGVDGIRTVMTCTEDQALTVSAGLHVGGLKSVVMVQNQGLYKSMNSLRAVCVDARVPIVLMIGQFGREAQNLGAPMRQSTRNMVKLLEPTLDAFGIPYWSIDSEDDLPHFRNAFASAWTTSGAAALIIGQCTTWR
jgi:sulfopyruvate decarboxylase TPP-binding subunit